MTFETQYAWLLGADRDGGGVGNSIQDATAEYQITFTVDNPTGATYSINIEQLRMGALTIIDDDSTGGALGSATLSGSTGSVDGIVDGALALAAVGTFSQGTTGSQTFAQTGNTTLATTYSDLSRTFVLNFTWTGNTTSTKDEAALRMGIQGGLTGATADDYPGNGGRTLGDDGHFVTVTTTILAPEPAPAALISLGLVALALRGRRAHAALKK